MIQSNGGSVPAFIDSACVDRSTASSSLASLERPQTGMDRSLAPRRYSPGGEMPQPQHGGSTMSANYQSLTNWGYSIIWASGEYCQAARDERDVTFRWNGEQWVEL